MESAAFGWMTAMQQAGSEPSNKDEGFAMKNYRSSMGDEDKMPVRRELLRSICNLKGIRRHSWAFEGIRRR